MGHAPGSRPAGGFGLPEPGRGTVTRRGGSRGRQAGRRQAAQDGRPGRRLWGAPVGHGALLGDGVAPHGEAHAHDGAGDEDQEHREGAGQQVQEGAEEGAAGDGLGQWGRGGRGGGAGSHAGLPHRAGPPAVPTAPQVPAPGRGPACTHADGRLQGCVLPRPPAGLAWTRVRCAPGRCSDGPAEAERPSRDQGRAPGRQGPLRAAPGSTRAPVLALRGHPHTLGLSAPPGSLSCPPRRPLPSHLPLPKVQSPARSPGRWSLGAPESVGVGDTGYPMGTAGHLPQEGQLPSLSLACQQVWCGQQQI